MLAEVSIVPLGEGRSVGRFVAECVKIIEASGLPYKMNPMATVIEGEYDEVMEVVKKCHMRVMELSWRTITTIKIDDRGMPGQIDAKIKSVEKILGHEVRR